MRLMSSLIWSAPLGFNPATLSLTGWWRANYSASPWSGTASAGSSGSNNISEASTPPATGTTQNGYTPADFDGTNDLLSGGAISTYFTAGAGSAWVLFYADTAGSTATNAYQEACLFSDSNGSYLAVSYSTSGVRAGIYDGAHKHTAYSAASTGAYHLTQVKWNGTNLLSRVDSGSWQSVAAGNVADLTNTLRVGMSASPPALVIDGRVLDIGMADSVLSDTTFDDIKSYCNARYALSL